jgi:cerevisin
MGTFTADQIEAIRMAPEVDFIEHDQVVHTMDVEEDAPWGLGRVSHKEHPDDVEMHHYIYDHNAGENVTAYVVDTGVNIEHVEFEGRAVWVCLLFSF